MSHMTRRNFIAIASGTGLALTSLGSVATTAFAQDDDKPTIKVGSKNFTEQMLMSEIVSLTLEDAGYPVERTFGLGGTAVVMEAIESSNIDAFVEYTGTGLMAVLGAELPTVDSAATPEESAAATPTGSSLSDQVYDIVKKRYDEELGLTWLDVWGFNNTYAMTVTRETADEYGLKTTSDLESVAGDMTLGTDLEFPLREDGLPGFEATYGFGFGDVKSGDPGLMYTAVDQGDVDVITAYTTDGRIQSLNLVILEDDLGFFPPYYAAPVIRNEVLEQHPEIADVLNRLGGQFTEDDMAGMNFEIDENGLEIAEAARPVLEAKGLIGGGD